MRNFVYVNLNNFTQKEIYTLLYYDSFKNRFLNDYFVVFFFFQMNQKQSFYVENHAVLIYANDIIYFIFTFYFFTVNDTEHKWYDIYYDVVTSKRIPMVQRFGERKDEPNTARFGRIPCSCQDLTCGCCAQFNVQIFNYNKRGLLKKN